MISNDSLKKRRMECVGVGNRVFHAIWVSRTLRGSVWTRSLGGWNSRWCCNQVPTWGAASLDERGNVLVIPVSKKQVSREVICTKTVKIGGMENEVGSGKGMSITPSCRSGFHEEGVKSRSILDSAVQRSTQHGGTVQLKSLTEEVCTSQANVQFSAPGSLPSH